MHCSNYVFFQYVRDIRIEGFMNIAHRNWVRIGRCYERWQIENLWADTEEERDRNMLGYYDDIFSLRKLFGIEPYDEIQEEEPW